MIVQWKIKILSKGKVCEGCQRDLQYIRVMQKSMEVHQNESIALRQEEQEQLLPGGFSIV